MNQLAIAVADFPPSKTVLLEIICNSPLVFNNNIKILDVDIDLKDANR